MSVCAKFQLSSWSGSGKSLLSWGGWVGGSEAEIRLRLSSAKLLTGTGTGTELGNKFGKVQNPDWTYFKRFNFSKQNASKFRSLA